MIDQVRGAHSTGVGIIRRFDNTFVVLKQPGPPQRLFDLAEYDKFIRESAKVIIGHNRYATKGAHTVENAHPFMFENVVGAHNGTLDWNAHKRLHNNAKHDTDSEAIFSHINEHSIQDAVDQMEGAWALTWYDVRDNTINFLRNSKRPLYYTYSEDRCTIIWASETEMLDFVLRRRGLKTSEEPGQYYVAETDQHLSWEVPKSLNDKFKVPLKVERKGKVWPQSAGRFQDQNQGYWWEDNSYRRYSPYGYFGGSSVSKSSSATGAQVSPAATQIRDTSKFRPPYKDAKGKVLKKNEFNALVSTGCIGCGGCDSEWGKFIEIIDTDGRRVFACEECYNDPDWAEIMTYMEPLGV